MTPRRTRVTPILDPQEKRRRELLYERKARNAAYLATKERQAERGEQAPEIIIPNMDVRRGEYTLDPYDKSGFRKVGELIENGRSVKPKQIVVHEEPALLTDGSIIPAGTVEFEWDQFQLPAVAEGLVCSHCWDPQPKDDHVRRENLRRLAEQTTYSVPDGMTHRDVCCYCGTVLGLQKTA